MGLQEINGRVCCYAASRLSHCCVINSNPRTLLCGCCKLLSLPAFKATFSCLVSFATCRVSELFSSAVTLSFMSVRFSQHSSLEAYGRLSASHSFSCLGRIKWWMSTTLKSNCRWEHGLFPLDTYIIVFTFSSANDKSSHLSGSYLFIHLMYG